MFFNIKTNIKVNKNKEYMHKFRVLLKPLKKENTDSIISLLDKEITKWINNIPYPPNRKDLIYWISQISKKKNKTFLIIKKSSPFQ